MAAQLPLLALAALGLGAIAIVRSNPKPKKEVSVSPRKKLMIHNLLKRTLSSDLGSIPPGGHIFITNPNEVYASTWYVDRHPFLTLGNRGTPDLERAVNSGHLYIGGISPNYVYIDQVEALSMVAGPKELVIANLTDQTLRLDGIPPVLSRTQFTYRGPLGHGLSLGSKFEDLSGVFPDYVMNEPITRLVYGVSGDQKAVRQISLTVSGMEKGERFSFMEPGGVLV